MGTYQQQYLTELGAETFTRTGNQTAVDFEGMIRTYPTDEPAFVGTRAIRNIAEGATSVENYISFGAASVAIANGEVTLTGLTGITTGAQDPINLGVSNEDIDARASNLIKADVPANIGKTVQLLFKRASGGASTTVLQTITLTEDYIRAGTPIRTGVASNTGYDFQVRGIASEATGCVFKECLVEELTGQANQNPSSFVLPGDAKHLLFENGNTIDGNGVITEAAGAAITTAEGVLLEDAETNIIIESEDFSDASWDLNNAVLTAGQSAPDGLLSSTTVTDNNAGGTGSVRVRELSVTVVSGESYTASIYLKEDQLDFAFIQVVSFDAGSAGRAWFDLGNGTLGTKDANIIDSSIEPAGDGFFRCSVVFISTTDLTGTINFGLAEADLGTTVDLDGTSSIFMFGAQIEQKAFTTSYIATAGSTVTRNATSVLADMSDDLNLGDPLNDIAFKWVGSFPYNFDVDRSSFDGVISMFVDTNNFLEIRTDNNNDRFFLSKETGGTGVETSTNDNELQPAKGTLVVIRARMTSVGMRMWINAGANSTIDENTTANAQADFAVAITTLGLNEKSNGDIGYGTYNHIQVWTGVDVPTDEFLAGLGTEFLTVGINDSAFVRDLVRGFVRDSVQDLVQ